MGSYGLMLNNTGGGITNGSTTAGSNLKTAIGNSSGALTTGGGAQSGTWQNISGGTVGAAGYGTFVRTA